MIVRRVHSVISSWRSRARQLQPTNGGCKSLPSTADCRRHSLLRPHALRTCTVPLRRRCPRYRTEFEDSRPFFHEALEDYATPRNMLIRNGHTSLPASVEGAVR
jgi:hypothetical protein